jgi:hypothetical protein
MEVGLALRQDVAYTIGQLEYKHKQTSIPGMGFEPMTVKD